MHLRKNRVQLLKVCFQTRECDNVFVACLRKTDDRKKNFSNWAWLSRSSGISYRLAFTSFSTPPPPSLSSPSSPAAPVAAATAATTAKLENYSFWDGKCDQVHFGNWIQLHCTTRWCASIRLHHWLVHFWISSLEVSFYMDSFRFFSSLFVWVSTFSFVLYCFFLLFYFWYLFKKFGCVCVWMWVCFFSLGNPPGWNAAFCDLYGTKRLIIPYKKQTRTRLIKMRRKNYSKFISNLFTTFSLSLLSRMVQVIWVKFQWKL